MSFSLDKSIEQELRSLPGNTICCDCDGKNPQWASVSFGIFMCLECSGRHRSLGVHISFVRSVSMDSWTEKQINMMRAGGNDECIAFLNNYNVSKNTPIATKYNTPAALLYRDRLQAKIDGRPLPTELPQQYNSGTSTISQSTDPIQGESEAQYIARQRQLQEEARDRMRQKFGASNGLSSKGSMQGIGSDSSYRPGASSTTTSGTGINAIEVTAQVSEAATKAFSFVSTFVSQAATATTASSSKSSSDTSSSGSSSSSGSGGGGGNEVFSKGWSMLTSNATDIWNKATVATNELVKDLTKPDTDDDFKFPRTATFTGKSASNSSSGSSSSGSIGSSSSSSSNGIQQQQQQQQQPLSSSSSYSNSNNKSNDSLRSNGSISDDSYHSNNSNDDFNKLNIDDDRDYHNSSNTSASNSSSTNVFSIKEKSVSKLTKPTRKKDPVATPIATTAADDDFFANFGVK